MGLSAVSLILAWPNAFSVLSYSNFSHGARTDFSLRTLDFITFSSLFLSLSFDVFLLFMFCILVTG